MENALTEPGSACCTHIINLAEIYYIYFRRGGQTLAESAIQDLLDLGIALCDDHDEAFWKEAASFKGRHVFKDFPCTKGRKVSGAR